VMTAVALWSHESGVAVLPLIVGLELLILWQSSRHRPSLWIAGHVAASLLFVLAWLTVEKAPFAERTTTAELHPKALFFLQGFTYPASAQILWLRDHRGIELGLLDVGVPVIVGVIGSYLVSQIVTGRRGLVFIPLLALGIGVAAAAPAIARLSWPYVQNSPRLLYLVCIGAALFWGLLPSLSFRFRLLTGVWRATTVLFVLFVVVQSWTFVNIRMMMFEEATRLVNGVVAEGERYQGQRVLIMNAPSWFAQGRYEYPYGNYGIQIMPSYIGFDRIIYASSRHAAETDARSGTWQADVSGGRYPFGPHGPDMTPEQIDAMLRDGFHLVDVRVEGLHYPVRDVGRLQVGTAEAPVAPAGRIGEGVWLSPARTADVNGWLTVYLTWDVLTPLGRDFDTVVELRDASGAVVATRTGYALAGFSAPRLWQAGDQVDDSVVFAMPAPGRYTLWAGLVQVGGGEMASAFDPNGDDLAGGFVPLGEVVIADGVATATGSAP
jgi:hypothetical protein